MIQIRDVPDRVHKVLARRAALAGMSLSDYLKQQFAEATSRWTWEELGDYIRSQAPVTFAEDPVDIIRQARGAL